MQTQVEDAGAIVVPTMDEMMDLVEILVRFPIPPAKGPGIITASGAYVGLTNDFAEEVGLELPEFEPATLKAVSEVLPAYGNYGNPLDVTAGFSPESLPLVVKAVLDDPNIGMLFISFPISYAAVVNAFNKGMADSPKPKVMVALGDTWQLAPDIMQAVDREPRGVLALVGSHAARDRALHALRPAAGARARRRAGRSRSTACRNSARARSRSGSARRCWPRPASACRPANLPAPSMTRPRSPSASAIPWS